MRGSHAALASVGLAFVLAASGCGADSSGTPRANAKVEPVAEAVPVSGPVLHGDYVVWGAGGSIEGGEPVEPIRISAARPPGSTRLLDELHMARNRVEWLGELAGSRGAVAFARGWDICVPPDYGSCSDTGADVRVGAENRRFEVLKPVGRRCDTYGFDVAGTRVAFAQNCRGRCPCGRLAIDDVTDARPPRTLVRGWEGFDDLHFAGRYAAGSTRDAIFVHDLETGRKITYTPPLPPPFFWGHRWIYTPFRFDLQADGKAVAVWGFSGKTSAAWFSPEEPDTHVLPLHPFFDDNAGGPAIRLAANRIAFERKFGDQESELVVADLDGNVEEVATFDRRHLRVAGFDFDGKSLTWASQKVVRFIKKCNGEPEGQGRYCWPQPVGPTTIYVARLTSSLSPP
jgi:hypothetical protein